MITFSVSGTPVPQGSIRILRGRVVAVSPRLHAWRMAVALAAIAARLRTPGTWPLEGEVAVELQFTVAGRPTARPDLDKLVRGVLDALVEADLIRDDAQIVELHAWKGRGREPGLTVHLKPR